jgi:DNA-binding MurR/RpiR family transcriptional regulator
MARSESKPLTKKEQTVVLTMFKGTKKQKGVKNARTIAASTGFSRNAVMRFLNESGLTSYAESNF